MPELKCTERSFEGWRAEIGMLAPFPGMYREYELVAPEGIQFSRAVMGLPKVTHDQLKDLADSAVTETKKLSLVGRKDLICFGCTSGSFIGGPGYDKQLIEGIEKAADGAPATTTTTCVIETFRDMGVKKIAVIGPYTDTIFDTIVEFFKAEDIETLAFKGLGYVTSKEYWKYYNDQYIVYKLAKEVFRAAPEVDCVFAACMMSTIIKVVDIVERETGKPLISSPSATLYGMLKKLAIPDPVYNYGEVLTRPRL